MITINVSGIIAKGYFFYCIVLCIGYITLGRCWKNSVYPEVIIAFISVVNRAHHMVVAKAAQVVVQIYNTQMPACGGG